MSDKIEACECGRTEQETWFAWNILDPCPSSAAHAGAYTFPILGDKYYTRRCACGWRIKRATEEDRDAAWNEVMRAVRMMKRLREPIGQSKDKGIDLTHLPKGKPTAYSEGGRA